MKKLLKKDKPRLVAAKARPKKKTATPKQRRAQYEEPVKEKESEFEEEEQEEDDDDSDEDEEEDMPDETQNPSSTDQQGDSDKGQGHKSVRGPGHGNGGKFDAGSTGHVGKPGGGDQQSGGGGDEEKVYVLGYGNTAAGMKTAKLYGEYYPREEVWQTLLDEAHAQEVYETEDYDRRIGVMQETQQKIDEVIVGTYDPDKLREDAKKINEARTDPEQVKEQSKKIQELRKKLYPQPHSGESSKA